MTEISSMVAISSVETDLARQQVLQNATPVLPSLNVAVDQPPDGQAEGALTAEEEKILQTAVKNINQMIEPLSINLHIKHIKTLNRFYVEMVNRETGEVIREIPPKQIIQMQENLRQYQGMMFDKFS